MHAIPRWRPGTVSAVPVPPSSIVTPQAAPIRMHLSRRRVFEIIVEVLIGLGLVTAVLLYAKFGPFPWMPSLRWWGLAGITGLLFGRAVTRYRRHWREPHFWLNVTWLLALHLSAWSILLARIREWGLLWFVPPGVVEAALLVVVLHKLGYDPRQ